MIKEKDDFAKNLRMLRRSKGLSQAQLAKELGVSCSIVAMWEQERREITKYHLKIIAGYFKISIDDLIGFDY